MKDKLFAQWQALLKIWSTDSDRTVQAFEVIVRHYTDPGRHYHTLEHIQNVLATVDTLAPNCRNLEAVKLAAWLHDVIYDSRAADNEERSAQFAEELCQKLAIPEGPVVARLILKTKTHDPGPDDPDAQVLLDADLAILGASEADYRIYAEQIHQEYTWVPEPDYRKGRCQILEKFLERPRIFHFLTHLEDAALRNLTAEIEQLA